MEWSLAFNHLFESVCGLRSPKIMWCIIIFSLKHALKNWGPYLPCWYKTIWQSRVGLSPTATTKSAFTRPEGREKKKNRVPLRISRKLMIQTVNHNFRILKWRYVSTIFLAIWIVGIFLKWPLRQETIGSTLVHDKSWCPKSWWYL